MEKNLIILLKYFRRHQLETPGRYSHLLAFYDDKKGTLPFGGSLPVSGSSHSISNLSSPGSEILPELKVKYNNAYYSTRKTSHQHYEACRRLGGGGWCGLFNKEDGEEVVHGLGGGGEGRFESGGPCSWQGETWAQFRRLMVGGGGGSSADLLPPVNRIPQTSESITVPCTSTWYL